MHTDFFFGCVAGCFVRVAAGVLVFVVTNSVFLVRELNLQRTAEPKLRLQEKWDDIKRYSSGTWIGGCGVVVGYLDSFRHGKPPNGTFFSDGMETVAVIKAEHRFRDVNYF